MINMSRREVSHAGQPGMNGSHGAYGSVSDSEERWASDGYRLMKVVRDLLQKHVRSFENDG